MAYLPSIRCLIDALKQSNNGQFAVSTEHLVVYWNQWMEQYSDISSAKAIGTPLDLLFEGQVKGRLKKAIEGALVRGKSAVLSRGFTPHPLPLKHPTLPGTLMTQRVSVRPFNDENNHRFCMIEVTDVSQSVRREQILYEQSQLIKEASKDLKEQASALKNSNQDLQELASDVEHSMRSHLEGLQNEINLAHNVKSADAIAIHQKVKKCAKSISSLLDGLKLLSKAASSKPSLKPVVLADLLKEILAEWQEQEDAEVILELDEMPIIQADPIWIRWITEQILHNSARFKGEKPLRLEVSALVLDDEKHARIFFRDYGLGLNDEEQKTAFRLFSNYHAESGSGVGLALCKRWVEGLGGDISIHRGRGCGCVVELRLPQIAANSDQNPAALSATGT